MMHELIARHRKALLCCAAAIFISNGAAAQQAEQTRQDAQEEAASNIAHTLLDQITVTSRTGETPVETMASVSHVGEEQLERRMATTPSGMLFGVPGIKIYSDGQPTMTNVNIRGLQDAGRVAVIVDGARQNFHKTGHEVGRMFWIDPELIQQVDVVRGPSANTFGSGAIGGVVYFRTKTAEDFLRADETWALSTNARFESNGSGWTTGATGAYRLSDRFSVLGGIVYRDYGDYKNGGGDKMADTGFDVLSGNVKATFRPTDLSELSLGWRGSRDDWTTKNSVINKLEDKTFTGEFKITDAEEKWLNLNVKGAYSAPKLSEIEPALTTDYNLDTTSIDIWNNSYFETAQVQHLLTVGADVIHDNFTSDEGGSGPDFFNPAGKRTAWGLHAQDKLKHEWLEVVAGLRYDSYKLEADEKSSGDRLSPRISVGVSPFSEGVLSGLQIYGSYAEGYRAPNISEAYISGIHPAGMPFPFLPNPNLKPETGKTWEAGINYKASGLVTQDDRLTLKAAYFHNDMRGFITTVQVRDPSRGCNAPWFCYQYQNVSSALIQGFELEGYYDAGRFFGGLSITAMDGHEEDAEGVRSTLVRAPLTITADAGMRFLENRLTVGAEIEYNKAPFGVSWAEDYTLVNIYADYEATDNMKVFFRADNLFDKKYQIPLVDTANNPNAYQPGLTLKLGATVRFGG